MPGFPTPRGPGHGEHAVDRRHGRRGDLEEATREVGFDEDAVRRRDKAVLIGHISRLE
jgi:hypothetical protein